MALPYDLAVGLGSAALGSGLTSAWHHSLLRVRFRNNREFWRFLERQTIFVVGEMQSAVLLNTLFESLAQSIPDPRSRRELVDELIGHIKTQENSGLVGRADFDAVASVILKLAELRIPMRPVVRHPNDLGDQRRHNLIVIGGPDVNALTRELLPRMGGQLTIRMNAVGKNMVWDSRLNSEHAVGIVRDPDSDEHMEVDYGIFARSKSPFNSESEIMIMAGAHGHGTLAACEVSLRDENQERLLHELRESPYHGIECLVYYRNQRQAPANNGEYRLEICRSTQSQVH